VVGTAWGGPAGGFLERAVGGKEVVGTAWGGPAGGFLERAVGGNAAAGPYRPGLPGDN